MRIIFNDDVEHVTAIPSGVFMARRHSLTGPLCLIAPCSGANGHYNVMDLEGRAGPAIGDIFSIEESTLRREFIPIMHSVTLRNVWR